MVREKSMADPEFLWRWESGDTLPKKNYYRKVKKTFKRYADAKYSHTEQWISCNEKEQSKLLVLAIKKDLYFKIRTVSYFEYSYSSRVPGEHLPRARAHARLCHASHIFEFLRRLCSRFQRKGIVWRHWILHTKYQRKAINILRFWKKRRYNHCKNKP